MAGSMTVEEAIGTVIHGTLLPEELLQAFLDQLEVVDGKRASEIRKEYARVFESLPQLADQSDKDGQALVIDAGECFDALTDALNACAPEGLFFGSHPGDGSDFGFWPIESHGSIEENDYPARVCCWCGERLPWDVEVCGCREGE